MAKTIDLFTGIGSMETAFRDTYSDIVEEEILNNTIIKCFEEIPAYSLNGIFHATQEEYRFARHLADLDIIELFCCLYVRNHRRYKYCRGRADTADHVITVLHEHGIYISSGKYNNWRREKGYRLIDEESLNLFLELLRITPSEFKRLIYAHISIRREIKETDESSGIILLTLQYTYTKEYLHAKTKPVRPPDQQAA